MNVKRGEFLSLTGKSGSGKSTLLYIMSSLDTPTSGSVFISDNDISIMKEKDLHEFRNKKIGFVFQFHYLLPELTVEENVLIPARKSSRHKEPGIIRYADELIGEFGISHVRSHYPSQLSGGERQRVAVARALIMEPDYIFADEPTGNLDSKNGEVIMKLFKQINREKHTTIIMVTHDTEFAAIAKRRIHLVDGKISKQK
jgi:putative ABC transport system ATP-binding protein/lipoprotein-releasing system ATP-binding protein